MISCPTCDHICVQPLRKPGDYQLTCAKCGAIIRVTIVMLRESEKTPEEIINLGNFSETEKAAMKAKITTATKQSE